MDECSSNTSNIFLALEKLKRLRRNLLRVRQCAHHKKQFNGLNSINDAARIN